MEFTGSAPFRARRDEVFAFFSDPTRLGPCLPVPVERVDALHYLAQARLGSGFLSTMVRVDLEITEAIEGWSATIVGRGGASGTVVEGSWRFAIRDGSTDDPTTVDWQAEIHLTGMFAGQASRLIEERAPEAIDQLLACIGRLLGG